MKSHENILSLENHNSKNDMNLIDGEIILTDRQGKIKIKGDDLELKNIYAYSVGHILNDLVATCWFSFLLYYLTDILLLDKKKAGWVMLSGQVFDGLATPLVGIFSDKINTPIGRRTPWYLGGTIGVIICFSLIFQKCTICQNTSNPEFWEMVYYITLPSLFNVAWASVQVSHMSLLPSISINRKNRDHMVRLRTAFTFSSQMLCLLMSFGIFYLIEDKFLQYSILSLLCVAVGTITSFYFLFNCNEKNLIKNIPKYYEQMKNSLDYSKNGYNSNVDNNNLIEKNIDEKISEIPSKNNHFKLQTNINQNNNSSNNNNYTIKLENNSSNSSVELKSGNINNTNSQFNITNPNNNTNYDNNNYNTILDENKKPQISLDKRLSDILNKNENLGVMYWLKKPAFYRNIIIYMLVRISINVTTSMLPYYLESIMGIKKTLKGGTPIQISLIYLTYSAGCLFNSLYLQKYLEKYNSRRVLLIAANIFTAMGTLPFLILTPRFNFPIYFLGFLFGIGFALGLSAASSLTNDVVGGKGDQAAFVYGAYSLTDKISCGILLFIFVDCVKDDYFLLKWIIPILPVASLVLALIVIKGNDKKENNSEKKDKIPDGDIECSKSLIDSSKFSFYSSH
jgi:Na+/melibiose symporter-like transporter